MIWMKIDFGKEEVEGGIISINIDVWKVYCNLFNGIAAIHSTRYQSIYLTKVLSTA